MNLLCLVRYFDDEGGRWDFVQVLTIWRVAFCCWRNESQFNSRGAFEQREAQTLRSGDGVPMNINLPIHIFLGRTAGKTYIEQQK